MIKNERLNLNNFLTSLIVLGPMFTQYAGIFDFILLPELFLLMLFPFLLIQSRDINFYKYRYLIIYIAIALFLTLITAFSQEYINFGVTITTYIRYLFYVLILIFVSDKYFNIDFGAKLLIIVANINAIYGIIQFMAYNFLGVVLPWYFPFLKVQYGQQLIQEQKYFFSTYGYRFSGLFSEPAHLSQYLSVALLIVLFYSSQSFKLSSFNKLFLSILYTIPLLLSGSGTGFAIAAMCYVLFIIGLLKKKKKDMNTIIKSYMFIFLIVFVSFLVLSSGNFTTGLTRIASISEVSTTYIRIIRPFEVYFSLPSYYQIIGVGYGNYAEYLFGTGNLTQYEVSRNIAWTNTLGFILVGSGLIGLIFYLLFYFKVSKGLNLLGKNLLLLLLAYTFFSDLPLTFHFITIMCFIYNLKANQVSSSTLFMKGDKI